MEFFQTGMGRKYYEYDFPQLVKELSRIANALEKLLEKKGGRYK